MHKFRVQTSGFISAFYSRGWICRWFSGFNPVDGCSRSSLEVSLLDVPLADASSSIAGFRFGSFWLQFCFYDFYFFFFFLRSSDASPLALFTLHFEWTYLFGAFFRCRLSAIWPAASGDPDFQILFWADAFSVTNSADWIYSRFHLYSILVLSNCSVHLMRSDLR